MPTQDAQKQPRRKPYELAQLDGQPSERHLADLMQQAVSLAPQPQLLMWEFGGDEFVLMVSFLLGPTKAPTWELSISNEGSSALVWSVTTGDINEVARMMLRGQNPSQDNQQKVVVLAAADGGSVPSSEQLSYKGLEVNDTFAGRYQIHKQIGQGGMGRVYQAGDLKDRRLVALKVLHPHLMNDPASRELFECEAQATISLRHPNLLTVYTYGCAPDGLPYIAMELVEGEGLHAIISIDGPMEFRRFLQVFLQTMQALHHAHCAGIIHRDVKPNNIMITKVNQLADLVKVVDFGVAKMNTGTDTLRGDEVFGSPYYMSPELCTGGALDPRSDIYSLGCVMYEAISGMRPFDGPSPMNTMQLQVSQPPKPFSEVCPELGISPRIEAIIRKMLEKNPKHRYQTIREAGHDLERLLVADELDLERQWKSEMTKTGSFVAYRGKKSDAGERANLQKVLSLLKECELISGQEFRYAVKLVEQSGKEATRYLLENGKMTEQSLHAAVQCQKLLERGDCKPELAFIALHYCQKGGITLKEAFDQLGWKMSSDVFELLDSRATGGHMPIRAEEI